MSRWMLLIAALGAAAACTAAARPGESETAGPAAPAMLASETELAGGPDSAPIAAPDETLPPPAPMSAAPASAPAAVSAVMAECDIRTRRTSRGVELEAVAWTSGAPQTGEYEFVVTKDDAGGSSDIVQGGAFDLVAGAPQSLGLAEVSVEPGGGYRARLVLRDSGGVVCRTETRS